MRGAGGGQGRGRFDMAFVRANMEGILDPRAVYGPQREEVPNLRNPRMGGFGGEREWPFFFWKAVYVRGYRAAVRRATGDERRHHEWRHIARLWLKWVDEVVVLMNMSAKAERDHEVAEAKLSGLLFNLEGTMLAGRYQEGLLPRVPLSGLERYIQ